MANQTMEHRRYNALDSIRGLAALFVMLGHYLPCKLVPWNFFLSGSESVIMFFMLSGFVLSNLLFNNKTTYYEYIIRRVFRIYPVYILVSSGVIAVLFIIKKI